MVKERRASADGCQRIRLFRAAFQPGLVEIDENGFEKETTLQNIVEQNISYLFPEQHWKCWISNSRETDTGRIQWHLIAARTHL